MRTIGRPALRTPRDRTLPTDEGGGHLKVIDTYERAVEHGDDASFREVFAPEVRIETPAGPSMTHPNTTASLIMSQVAKTAPGIRSTSTADAGSNWHFLGFEGQIEGQAFQAVDQVHVNRDNKIDHLVIYMRPLSTAQKFAEAITRRLQPTS
jgi:hypothetical protein